MPYRPPAKNAGKTPAPRKPTFADIHAAAGGKPVTKTRSNLGHELVGIVPGLYHTAGGFIHHPTETGRAISRSTLQSFKETGTHPIRQLENDPLGFVGNVSLVAAAPGSVLG